MIADSEFVIRTFNKFNKLIFDGGLPPIPVKMTSARRFVGKVNYSIRRGLFGRIIGNDCFEMRISSCFDLPEADLEDVIIHEMIHYHIALNNIRDSSSHGRIFRSMMSDINRRFGRNITIRHTDPGPINKSTGKGSTVSYFCVSELADGSRGITVCAKTRIFHIFRTFSRYYRVEKQEWFGSTDPYFSRFPHSLTPKIYKVDESELNLHLKNSVPMICDGRSLKRK